jgi:hypothetical protein
MLDLLHLHCSKGVEVDDKCDEMQFEMGL